MSDHWNTIIAELEAHAKYRSKQYNLYGIGDNDFDSLRLRDIMRNIVHEAQWDKAATPAEYQEAIKRLLEQGTIVISRDGIELSDQARKYLED